jgi:hypothetical protein
MRRHLFLAIAMLLPAGLQAAMACGREPGRLWQPEEALFAKAAAVLFVHVSRVEEVKIERTGPSSPPIVTVEATFRVEEALKGTPPADNKIRYQKPLLAGVGYLLFLDAGHVVLDGDAPGCNTVPRIIMKGPDGKADSMSLRLIEQLRDLAKKDQK